MKSKSLCHKSVRHRSFNFFSLLFSDNTPGKTNKETKKNFKQNYTKKIRKVVNKN